MTTFTHDPQARLDYSVDWSAWLAENESITETEWDVPAGLSPSDEITLAGVCTVWLEGGTAGQRYPVVCQISTSQGRRDERTIWLLVRDR